MMPVIVIGADTAVGAAIVTALSDRDGEVRAFVTDPTVAAELKNGGVKVAVGDVSDASHVEGAAMNCFCAVLITDAAGDQRVRSFAAQPESVLDGWRSAVRASGLTRAIWVADEIAAPTEGGETPERVVVDGRGRSVADVAAEVARLEDAAELSD